MNKAIFMAALYLIFVFPCYANQQILAMPIQDKLKEARDYLSVLPERSLAILSNKEHLLSIDSQETLADWYDAKLIAAIRVANLQQIYLTLLEISELQNTVFFQKHSSTTFNGIGIWMRRSGFLKEAKISYACSLENSKTERAKISPMLNLGIVETKLGNNASAKQLYNLAFNTAEKYEMENIFAVVENSLGNIALSEGNYPEAERLYASALERNEKLMRRSGELTSGLNLLLSFLYQDKLDLFSRLSGRIERKLKRSEVGIKTATFEILKAVYTARIDKAATSDLTEVIARNMKMIKDKSLQKLLSDLIGVYGLAWDDKIIEGNQAQRDHLQARYPSCDWDKFSDENYISVLISQFDQTQALKEN